jgi:hypothetical protein
MSPNMCPNMPPNTSPAIPSSHFAHPSRRASAKLRAPLALTCLALFGLAALGEEPRTEQAKPVILGEGAHRFEWVRGWGQLPEGVKLGNTHGSVLLDRAGRVYVNTDTENAVIVFDAEGKFVKSWGKELAGGVHGMWIASEGEKEFLYLAHIGRREVLKTTLDGEIVWTLPCPMESGKYEQPNQWAPTSVVVAPDGRLVVADGYGRSWIHVFDAERKYVRSFGGPGGEIGKLATPHGLWLDLVDDQPLLVVADRENHRLQFFDLEGKPAREPVGELRRPCSAHRSNGELVVADLAGRVTLFDAENKLVAHLGDNPDEAKRAQNGVPLEQWKDGEFLSPHSARLAPNGDIYVVDWNFLGRVTKLRRLK